MMYLKCPYCGSPEIFRQSVSEDDDATQWVCETCSETFYDEDVIDDEIGALLIDDEDFSDVHLPPELEDDES